MRSTALSVAAAVLAGSLLAGCSSNSRAIDYYVVGQLAYERQDYGAALAELKKALEVNPKLSVAHAAVGDVYRKQGRYDLAASAYEQACRSDPTAFRPHYNLGVMYQLLAGAAESAQAAAEYIRKAVQVYLRALLLQPEDFETNLNLSACYFQQGKLDLAEQYCLAAVRIDPHHPYAHSNLGLIYDAQDRPEEAIRAFRDSLEREIHQPRVLENLGTIYMRMGRLGEAIKAFQLSVEQDPSAAGPWEQMGTCYYHQGKWPQALAAYEKALQLNPESPTAYRGLGVVRMTQFVMDRSRGDLRDQALGAWRRSLELKADQDDLRRLLHKYTPASAAPAPAQLGSLP